MTVLMILGVAVLALMGGSGEPDPGDTRKKRSGFWGLAAVVAILLIWQPEFELPAGREGEALDIGLTGNDALEDDLAVVDQREPVAELSDLLLIAVGVGVLAVVVLLSRRRTTPLESSEPSPFDGLDAEPDAIELAHAVDRAVGQLQADGDSRAAVIAAYAELEAVLSTYGQQRLVAETVNEHLTRAVATLGVDPKPFQRLGRLYEVARFSTDTISSQDQQAAAISLASASDELLANA